MEIREATRADEPAVTTDLLVPGFRDSAAKAPDYNELDEVGVSEAGLDRWLDCDDRVAFVAERDDELVGYIAGVRSESPDIYARGARTHVDGLYVVEEHRREGVASALFDRIADWARAEGCEFLGVSAHVDNDAAVEMYDDAFERTYVSYRRRLGDE
ncbi:GNAT family N-acetyltransferase [Halobacterium litoreum]|uniref:GNAT family N-acetyltransferase n=1 Tax=Halobacterium litoreum TaxID=2039234 RepID=A0ABD5NH72_9EURY|nr:GNAT family N-acetyltransferase [Halobacterium litoreum]UHH12638.1 GNAT family N-acetyltransferase [Halobacterium litoreum]